VRSVVCVRVDTFSFTNRLPDTPKITSGSLFDQIASPGSPSEPIGA